MGEFADPVNEDDPIWMKKKKQKKKLDSVEIEEYYHYKYEKSLQELKDNQRFEGVPSVGKIVHIAREYHKFKKACLSSFTAC